MKYTHRFRVEAPLPAVAEFHSRSASMPAITPPPMIVRVHAAPERMTSGDQMDFTLWAGPIPVRWLARIEDASAEGFTDRQIRGPFAAWAHRHTYVRVDDRTTDVVDEVEAKLKRHPFWGLAGAADVDRDAGAVCVSRLGRRDGYWKLEAGSWNGEK